MDYWLSNCLSVVSSWCLLQIIEVAVGRGIQCVLQSTKVIFVSTHTENLPEVFSIQSTCFLYKPYDQDTFYRTIRTVIHKNSNEYLLNCILNDRRYNISSKQIRYIEVFNHNLVAHTDKEYFLDRSSLDELEKRLLPYGFFRCHRSFLINLDYSL